MKKYSSYFITLMCTAFLALMNAGILIYINYPNASAVLLVIAFICWFAGVQAPDHEKYRDK